MSGGWQTKFNVSPGPGLSPGTLDLLDLTWDLDLDLSLTILHNGVRNVTMVPIIPVCIVSKTFRNLRKVQIEDIGLACVCGLLSAIWAGY